MPTEMSEQIQPHRIHDWLCVARLRRTKRWPSLWVCSILHGFVRKVVHDAMKLLRLRLVDLGPFTDVTVSFRGPDDAPRSMTVVFGGAGVGKTTLLSAIATTRPGHAVASVTPGSGPRGFAVADWDLGDDDPDRPHPLRVASPNASLDEETEDERLRRREQGLFDRRAVDQGGFVVLCQTAQRWYSRSPVTLSAPSRTVLRYDVRAPAHFDDASHSDLARETKQTLLFSSVGSRLTEAETGRPVTSFGVLDEALRDMLRRLLDLARFRYVGIDPTTLEPMFATDQGDVVAFDRLPTSIRHLVGFAVLTVRGLFAAYPGRDPRMTEGLVLIDEVALHQETAVQRGLVPALRGALPRVQWLLTTSSADVTTGCEPHEVLALRRMPATRSVELFEGPLATLH